PLVADGALVFGLRLSRSAKVGIRLFDVAGRIVASQPETSMLSGQRQFSWKPEGVRSGVYFVRVAVNGRQAMQKRVIFIR
ncbi:MAG: T9SS type A sorting domain-containing protein, partial [Candidatus Eisenbacteria bacterium]|nr:T9SS type A sorting domain-containing protein [Candidatus Eisenbacteria bacterium]